MNDAMTPEPDTRTEPQADRETMECDVVVVGAGPAGLGAAIRLKQLAAEAEREISVVVLEKGSEVGAHILSGAVIDPVTLDRLIPDWRETGGPSDSPVTEDRFLYLTEKSAVPLPQFLMPPLMKNHGCYVGSLGNLCRFLAERAEALGVEIYPGFAARSLLIGAGGAVEGVTTGDMGVGRDGKPTDAYQPGLELRAKYTLIGEGARGSLAKELMARFGLCEGKSPQKYGIGLKELWRIAPDKHKRGLVQHTLGWPLDNATGGGSFLYHFGEDLAAVGFVVHLDYPNPYLSPFDEFQRFKTHPAIRATFEGGERISYGARAITEGGWQSVPKLIFPGGALIGCAAGFVNVPRIKGSHNAMQSGIEAAETAFAAIVAGRSHDELAEYEANWRGGPIGHDLKPVRNVKPLLARFGTMLGTMLGGIEMWLNTLLPKLGYTLAHLKPDWATLKRADESKPLAYPKPDGKITFDRLSSVFVSGTNHDEDQPVHLVLADPAIPIRENLPLFAEPARLYCPAAVYEVVEEDAGPRFQINAQNCVHCKTCDIKDPAQNITWVPPQGGDGPNYPNM